MSQENVERARRGLEAFNAHDTEAFVEFWHPTCEFFTVTGSRMDGTPYRGHEGIRQYMAEVEEAWTGFRFDTDEVREGKDGAVVAVGYLRGKGRESGAAVEQRMGVVWRFEGGKLRHCRAYANPADALEAVGLRE
jgi:ketosteroid isomerase-like protein